MLEPAICVRYATIGDAAALSTFAAAIFPLGCPPGADPGDLTDHIARKLTAECFRTLIEDPNTVLFVAELADKICGCVQALRSSPHPQIEAVAAAELQKFYVAPAQQGRGVADQLMRRALAILEHNPVDAVWLSVNCENPRAIAFYKRWGFCIVGTHKLLVGADPQQDFIMRRDVPLVSQEGIK